MCIRDRCEEIDKALGFFSFDRGRGYCLYLIGSSRAEPILLAQAFGRQRTRLQSPLSSLKWDHVVGRFDRTPSSAEILQNTDGISDEGTLHYIATSPPWLGVKPCLRQP